MKVEPGNTKGGSITVLLTSCLTGLDESVLQIETKIVSCHTADSKPAKQEVNSTVILPSLVFLGRAALLQIIMRKAPCQWSILLTNLCLMQRRVHKVNGAKDAVLLYQHF